MIGALPMWKRALKRTVDIGGAILGLLLLAPLLLASALCEPSIFAKDEPSKDASAPSPQSGST